MHADQVVKIYNALPALRRKVLDRILIGRSKIRIAHELCNGSVDAVTAHFKEIYRDCGELLKDADPESKRAELIRVFYSQAPALVARIRAELESAAGARAVCSQFGGVIEQANEYRYELRKVAKEEIPALQVLGRRFFQGQDHLPTRLLESWFERDPNAFRKMQNRNGRIVAFFIVLLLKARAFARFAAGGLIERELQAGDLLPPREPPSRLEEHLYISAVAAEPGHPISSVCILLYLARYLDLTRSHRNIARLHATAATESGRHLMLEHFEFRLHTPAGERRDGEDFLVADLCDHEPDLYTRLIERYPSFRHYSRNLDLKNPEEWAPDYGLHALLSPHSGHQGLRT